MNEAAVNSICMYLSSESSHHHARAHAHVHVQSQARLQVYMFSVCVCLCVFLREIILFGLVDNDNIGIAPHIRLYTQAKY